MEVLNTLFILLVVCFGYSVKALSINMKGLILTTKAYVANDNTPKLIMQAYSIPCDIIELDDSNVPSGNLTLIDEDNQPIYNFIVTLGGSLSHEDKSTGLWVSYLSNEQWAYIEEYETKYGVRRVAIDSNVSSNDNVELFDPNNWGQTYSQQSIFPATNDYTMAIFNATRMNPSAPFDISTIYCTKVKITNTENTKPLFYYDEAGETGVAATLVTYPDGRERMNFYFGFGSWSLSCIFLSHLWLNWATHNIYNGFRRVYFSPQIDDVFLSTELIDLKHGLVESDTSEVYRNSPSDIDHIIQFQKNVLDIMPAGSKYQVEMAFNGNGFLLAIDYETAVEVDGERYVDLEFVKEPGTGEKRWPKANYTLEFPLSHYQKDALFNYFYQNDEIQKNFYWSSHTFSHENLDNASESDVDNEIRNNIEMARILGLIGKEWWSEHAIITPQISGLHNKDALDVFKKYGINAATGDLSRPAIINNENPYLPFYTTEESSHYEGFPIIPRTPTEIYYMCGSRDENVWMYNNIYYNHFGKNSTWEEIEDRESKRTLLLMAKLRHEAHQFHQANLHYYESKNNYGNSLLEDWTRAVVNLYTKYVDWPLISLKIDDIMDSFIEREKLDKCGEEVKLIVDNKMVTGFTATATKGDCKIPVTVPGSVNKSNLPEGVTLEQIGHDPLTVWVELKKGESKTVELSPAFEWGGNDSIISSPSQTSTSSEEPEATTTSSEKPEATTTSSEKPEATTTSSEKPEATTTSSEEPKGTTTIKVTVTVTETPVESTTKKTSTTTKKTTTTTTTIIKTTTTIIKTTSIPTTTAPVLTTRTQTVTTTPSLSSEQKCLQTGSCIKCFSILSSNFLKCLLGGFN